MSKPVSTNSKNISNAASSRQADGANRTGGTHRTSGSNGASGTNDRPTPQRQTTSDILEYYNSAEASVGYSVADLEQARTSQAQSHSHSTSSHRERPSTAPTAPIASTSPNNNVPQAPRPSSSSQRASEAAAKKASESPQNSIRVVTHTHTQTNTNTNTTPNVNKRRPSIPHSDAAAAADNRRIAIIERDQSPIPNSPARSPNSPLSLATGNSNSTSNAHGSPSAANSPSSGTHASPTILTRRGVDRTRLALVSPPEVAPTIQVVNNASPSASASFLLSKSSRSKFADKPSPALPPEALAAEGTSSSNPHGNASNSHSRGDKGDQRHGTSKHGHTRAASEATATAHNPSSAKSVTKPVVSHQHTPSNSESISPKTPHSPRDIGIVGTVQSMSRNKDLHKGFEKEQVAYISNHQGHQGRHAGHSRHRSAEYASSGSDYGEEPVFAMSGDFPISMNPHSPVFQTPRPDEGGSEQPNGYPNEQRNTVATGTAATTTSANSGRTGHDHKSRYGSAPATGHEHGSGSGKGGKHASSDIKQGHVHMASPMHMTMPPIPQRFGSTPLLTPAIGDSKPIDVKVAAPVVVDIHSDLADLWLAATPDRDMDKLNHINHVNHGKQFDRLGNIDHVGDAGTGGGSSLGSPLTALTSATSPTDSSSLPTDFSVPSSRKSSVASPYMRTSFEPLVEPAATVPAPGPKSGAGANAGVGVATIKGVEPTAGTVTGAGTGTGTRPAAMTIPIPPRRIDIGSLSPSISPVCPPRPHRQPSPAKGHQPSSVSSREGIAARSSSSISTVSIDEKDEDIDKVQMITKVKEKDRNERERESMNLPEPPPKDSQSKKSKNPKNSKASSEYPLDPKYMLLALSDSESGSEYSHDIHPKKDSRSLSTSAHSTQSKNGSIHIREGAFPAHSVFLNRIKTEVTVEPPEADMKTPTRRSTVAALFSMSDNGHGHGSDSGILVDASNVSIRTVDSSGIIALKSTSSSHKLNKAPSQSELAGSKSSKSTAATSDSVESTTDENGVRKRSRSLRLPRKRSLTKGKKDGGPSPIEAKDTTPFDTRPESPTDSTHTHTTSHTQSHANGQAAEHRHDSHSHIGHGPPPSGRAGATGLATTNTSQAPSAFKAKGPLATSGSLKTSRSQPLSNKPKSSWPPAMSFTDVLAEPTPIARALGYAAKIAELATEDCGLGDWIEHVLNRTRPTIMTDDGPIPVGPVHTRFVSGSSAMSELTFPMRPDAYKVMDLTPGAVEISTTEVPSKMPYPSLALQQGKPGYRQPLSAVAPPKSLSAAVKSGSAGFFSSLGRKASMRTRGTQSATESREREPRPTRRLVSKRAPPERGGNGSPPGGTPPQSSTPSLTPVTTVSALPSLPTLGAPSLPGGPRAPRAKRASTMMISAPRPIISAPISQAPLSAAPTGLAQTVQTALSSSQPAPSNQWNISPPASSGYTTEPPRASHSSDIGHTMQATTMKLGEVPRRPEGPRPVSKLARTPSFPGPGSYRVSQAGNLRSTASFRPPPSSAMDHTGSGAARDLSPGSLTNNATGNGRQVQAGRSSDDFTVQLDKLCDILPNAERDTLALYLNRANGMNMIAIGRYLEDERKGTVTKA